jgi:hypothetical protein
LIRTVPAARFLYKHVIRAPDENGSFPGIADVGPEIRLPPIGFPVNSERISIALTSTPVLIYGLLYLHPIFDDL